MNPPATHSSSTPLPARPLGETCTTLILAWLIPGLGHVMQRDTKRGLILFFVTQITFGLGLILQGAVLWPVYSPADWGLNAVNFLTFLVQLGNGLAALLCLAVSSLLPDWTEALRAHTLFEIGTMYLLISGAVNSISVGALYDLYFRRGRPARFAKL